MEWALEDVEKVNQANPYTFYIPSLEKRSHQKKGDLVRLHFIIINPTENGLRAERMWVEIRRKNIFGNKYIGVLTNQPVYLKSLNIGDEIQFEPKHIARIIVKQDAPFYLNIGEKMALVSTKCLDNDGVVRWLYREKPDRHEDSGWRMFDGTEDSEFCDDANNVRVVNIYYLLDKDPSLLSPLKGDIGSAFERDDKKCPWREVIDWDGYRS